MDTAQLQADFMLIIQQYERLIHKVCAVYTTTDEEKKDLFQEIVLQAWKAFPRFEGRSEISTWLYRIALNTAINQYRKLQRSPSIVYPDTINHHSEDQLSTAEAEQYKLLQQLIAGLPPLDKALLLLYMEDKSYNEIGLIMGITITNVGTKLNRIKDKLKQKAKSFIN